MAKSIPRVGTHYTLSRHEPKPEVPKVKVCIDCKSAKMNTFQFFGKKMQGTRDNFVTTDVCKECSGKKISDRLQQKNQAMRKAAEEYAAETLARKLKAMDI